MDLLGRKARKQLDELAVTSVRYIKFLDSKCKDLTEQRDRFQRELIETKLQLEAAKPKPIKAQSLYLNETEEDIEYAYKNELINRAEYEDMLAQLEFDNTEITFDLERY